MFATEYCQCRSQKKVVKCITTVQEIVYWLYKHGQAWIPPEPAYQLRQLENFSVNNNTHSLPAEVWYEALQRGTCYTKICNESRQENTDIKSIKRWTGDTSADSLPSIQRDWALILMHIIQRRLFVSRDQTKALLWISARTAWVNNKRTIGRMTADPYSCAAYCWGLDHPHVTVMRA